MRALVDRRLDVTAVARALPTWCVQPASPLDTAADPVDVAVVFLAAAHTVRSLHRRYPGALVVVVVDEDTDPQLVTNALGAGADACSRGRDPRLVAAYMRASARHAGLLRAG